MTSWSMAARLSVRSLLQNTRYYSRKVVRRPVKILSEDEVANGEKMERLHPGWVNPALEKAFVRPAEAPSFTNGDDEPVFLEGKTSRLPPGFPRYDNKGKDDSKLSRMVLDTSCPKKRQKSGLIMLEGKRIIQEALNANLKLKALFFSDVETVTFMQLPQLQCTFQKLTYNQIKRWSKVATPSGVIGFFEMPNTSHKKTESALPFSIICDNVRDPGNLGSILRVAASAGCRSVLLTKGCVDLWNDKVVRSGMGSHFHLCIKENVKWCEIQQQIEPDSFIMFADNRNMNCTNSDSIIRDDIYYESSFENMENTQWPEEPDVLSDDKNTPSGNKSSGEPPIFPYYQIAYSQMNSIYLVVGGETEGISSEAFNLGKPDQCFRVNIPMLNNVESLNVCSALAILTHEIKRQFELFGKRDGAADSTDAPIPITTI